MKVRKDKLSIIIALIAVIGMVVFLIVIQKVQNDSHKNYVQKEQTKSKEENDSLQTGRDDIDICINEVSKDGWIEIYNPRDGDIILSGYSLIVNDNKLSINSKEIVKSGGYKAIEIDSKALKSDNNLVELFSKDKKIDSCVVGKLKAGQSYGRKKDGQASFYIMESTKGKSNSKAQIILDTNPRFSMPSGFYSDKITVTISASNSQKIYYTTDGSTPTQNSTLYTKPIEIDDRTGEENKWSAVSNISTTINYVPQYKVDKCTVLRAIAVDPSGRVSDVVSATYGISIGDKSTYQDIPIISIVTDADEMFDDYGGLYVLGKTYEDMIAREEEDDIYANFMQDTKISAKVQFFGEDHYNTRNINTKLQIYQDEAADLGQKSMSFKAGDEEFLLSSCGYDYVMKSRQGIANLLLKDTNIEVPSDMYIVFIDGEFWGLYRLAEPFDSKYVAKHTNSESNDIITVVNGISKDSEGQLEYNRMKANVLYGNLGVSANYENICKTVDVESYANFICGSIFLANYSDTIVPYVWKDSKDGLWKWAIGDQTNSLGGAATSTYSINTYLRPAFADNLFLKQMMKSSQFRETLQKCMNKMCDDYFLAENVDKKIESYTDKYGKAIVETWNRFSGENVLENYKIQTNNIEEFIAKRREFAKKYTDEFIEEASK